MKSLFCLMLALMALTLFGCAPALAGPQPAESAPMATPQHEDTPIGLPPEPPGNAASDYHAAYFSVELFRWALAESEEQNVLLSPISVLSALGMAANGAAGATKDEFNIVHGMLPESLNQYIADYMEGLPASAALHLANSVWLRDTPSLEVEQAFLQAAQQYYGAGVFEAEFNQSTVQKINEWVGQNTNGRITNILQQIPGDAMLYLANALAFEAEWETPYYKQQVAEGKFTSASGRVQPVEMMHGTEWQYLQYGRATGFMKYYKGRDFAFVALLPNEGVSAREYALNLDSEALTELLKNPQETEVITAMPKFSAEYGTELSAVLKRMGMQLAFEPLEADFSAMGHSQEGNLFIGQVLHKAFISVHENGTEAGAATLVDMPAGAAMPEEEPKCVVLDRPFVYMLVDTRSMLPLFMGVLEELG